MPGSHQCYHWVLNWFLLINFDNFTILFTLSIFESVGNFWQIWTILTLLTNKNFLQFWEILTVGHFFCQIWQFWNVLTISYNFRNFAFLPILKLLYHFCNFLWQFFDKHLFQFHYNEWLSRRYGDSDTITISARQPLCADMVIVWQVLTCQGMGSGWGMTASRWRSSLCYSGLV